MTRHGLTGSSAGPGSATAAGLVAFSIGTDTGGSVIQPSARNGLTGMRPTFGRVSRYGAMALAWTQDTVGPMCRSAEDCALVFNTIYGPDGKDNSVLDVPFGWDATADVAKLRVGYLRSAFNDNPARRQRKGRKQRGRIVIIRGQYRAKTASDHLGRVGPSGVASAAHHIRRAEHDVVALRSRFLGSLDRGWKFRQSAAE